MKKVFPTLIVALVFCCLVVVQMLVHGQKLTAVNITANSEKFSAFESQFTKLKGSTTRGTEVDLNKVDEPIVVVNFWASWCKPCISEFGSLKKLKESYPGQVQILGINNDTEDQLKAIKKIETKYELNFESMADTEGSIAEAFNVTRVPASIIFHKGKVIYFANKETDFQSEELQSIIKSKL